MNDIIKNTASSSKNQTPMEIFIKGKIDSRRRYESTWFTRMITPAPDAYSRPSTVEVRSKNKLGEIGEETSVTCKLGGYTRKPYRITDRDTGETSTITPVDLTLDLIE